MPKYQVHLSVPVFFVMTIEGPNEDYAVDLARERSRPTLCAECGGQGEEWEMKLGKEWDQWEVVREVDDA